MDLPRSLLSWQGHNQSTRGLPNKTGLVVTLFLQSCRRMVGHAVEVFMMSVPCKGETSNGIQAQRTALRRGAHACKVFAASALLIMCCVSNMECTGLSAALSGNSWLGLADEESRRSW